MLIAVYLASWPPDITFEDGPIFAAACYSRGLAHPPGYPLHTLLCWPLAQLADFLPLSIAQASALASLIPAVAACLLVARLAAISTGCWPAGLVAAGLLGLAPGFWSQAIIPESYALNAFLIAAAWTAADEYVRRQSPAMLPVLALLCGLGLANHWPLFVLPAPALLLWLLQARRRLVADLACRRMLLGVSAAFAVGLLPYLHLYFFAADGYQFADAREKGFYWYVSRQAYGGTDVSGFSLERIPDMGIALLLLAKQYAYIFAAAGAAGLWWMSRCGRRLQAAAVLWAVCSCTVLLVFIRSPAASQYLAAEVFVVYPLPAYLWFALPIAVAAAFILRRLPDWSGLQWGSCALLLAAVVVLRFPAVDRSSDKVALEYANRLLGGLPADATLLVPSIDYYFGVHYLQQQAGFRPDVRLLKESDLFEQLDRSFKLTVEQQQQLAALAPVAFVSDFQLSEHGRTMRGMYYTLSGGDTGDTVVQLDEQDREYYLRLIEQAASGSLTNGWTHRFVLQEIGEIAKFLAMDAVRGKGQNENLELLKAALRLPAGRYGRFIAESTGGFLTPQQVIAAAIVLEEDFPDLYPEWRARVLHLAGYAFFLQGDIESSVDLFERSLAQFPNADNSRTIIDLLQTYAISQRFEDYRRLRNRFADFNAGEALKRTDAACQRHFQSACFEHVKESAP